MVDTEEKSIFAGHPPNYYLDEAVDLFRQAQDLAISRGDTDEAIQVVNQALGLFAEAERADPSNVAVQREWAQALCLQAALTDDMDVAKERYEEAIPHFRSARSLAPEDGAIALMLGSALTNLGNAAAEEAEDYLREAEKLFAFAEKKESTPSVYVMWGTNLELLAKRVRDPKERGELHARADQTFRRGAEAFPEETALHKRWARLLSDRRKPENPDADQRDPDALKEAGTLWRKVLDKDLTDGEAYREAAETSYRLAEIAPDSRAAVRHINDATKTLELGIRVEAGETLSDALRGRIRWRNASAAVSQAPEFARSQLRAAIDLFRQHLADFPEDADTWDDLAHVLAREATSFPDGFLVEPALEAIEAFREAYRVKPDEVTALESAGEFAAVAVERSSGEDALQFAQLAVEIFSEVATHHPLLLSHVRVVESLGLLALVASRAGAEENVDKALEKAEELTRRDDLDLAEQAMLKATLARALTAVGRSMEDAQALSHLERAAALYSDLDADDLLDPEQCLDATRCFKALAVIQTGLRQQQSYATAHRLLQKVSDAKEGNPHILLEWALLLTEYALVLETRQADEVFALSQGKFREAHQHAPKDRELREEITIQWADSLLDWASENDSDGQRSFVEAAKAKVEPVVDAGSDNSAAYVVLARCLTLLHDANQSWEDAFEPCIDRPRKLVKQALEIEPEDGRHLVYLAYLTIFSAAKGPKHRRDEFLEEYELLLVRIKQAIVNQDGDPSSLAELDAYRERLMSETRRDWKDWFARYGWMVALLAYLVLKLVRLAMQNN